MNRAVPWVAAGLLLAVACAEDGPTTPRVPRGLPEYARVVELGGETTDTTGASSSFAFSTPATNLTPENLEKHLSGDLFFESSFVPHGEPGQAASDGLGPAFNHSSCLACHVGDGRGSLPRTGGGFVPFGQNESALVRISLDAGDPDDCVPSAANTFCAPVPVPGFGVQLFHRGVFDIRPDAPFVGQAQIFLRYEERVVDYADGPQVTLRRPIFYVANPYDDPGAVPGSGSASRLLQPDVRFGLRNSMPVFGLGLLEAIEEGDILSRADPDDLDGDGISGRPNYVFDPVAARAGSPNPVSLGRFGWKANAPSLLAQAAEALRDDIGVTSFLLPTESIAGTPLHASYLATNPDDTGAGPDGSPEATDLFLNDVTFYVQTLAVPVRRNVEDADVLAGSRLFEQLGCADCHRPGYVTGRHPEGFDELSFQEIWPFTDMLLHDMGEDLADGRSDFLANGREWKTRPLWGLGRTFAVNAVAGLLHDGRARTIEEAILWHGGEAEESRDSFRGLDAEEREALLAFLNSL